MHKTTTTTTIKLQKKGDPGCIVVASGNLTVIKAPLCILDSLPQLP
jgi:hypothetical protein